ncbi:hypothetical protein GCM10027275_06560 [Rhabdobacter roseus]
MRYLAVLVFIGWGCQEKEESVRPSVFSLNATRVNGVSSGFTYTNLAASPVVKLSFSTKIDRASVVPSVTFTGTSGTGVGFNTTYENSDSTLVIQPSAPLGSLATYTLAVSTTLKSQAGGTLQIPVTVSLRTALDSSDKFPVLSETALLDKVQSQTFKYFWDFAHPVSGLARERNTSGDLVTSGGSGFGIMTIPVAIQRHFISRAEGLARMQKIVGFLKNNAQTFHGAFPHWLNGATGAALPFSAKDDGADLVETSFLIQGLLTARQYFNGTDAAETALRADINAIWEAVEWDWFRRGDQNVLYWHWSPVHGWDMNLPIRGWNECLITYVLAAASPTHPIPKVVYDNGWTQNGGFANGNTYYGYRLPLGSAYGGPLFYAHYSFLGLDPRQLTDAHANYWTQNQHHTLINQAYCIDNPQKYYGYSAECWGLTASDIPNGYTANSPTNDRGVITPTAALSSFPYAPEQSMKALKFFYYKLGDKLWGEYGFHDAFSLHEPWFASSYLAIDQGPIVLMIENHRSGLLWELFMSSPEAKAGLRKLAFQSPHL